MAPARLYAAAAAAVLGGAAGAYYVYRRLCARTPCFDGFDGLYAYARRRLSRLEGPSAAGLSRRSAGALEESEADEALLRGLKNQYSAEDNRSGYLVLSVAENKLSFDELALPLKAACACVPDEQVFGYDDMRGTWRFRSAMARFLSRHLCPTVEVKPEHVVLASGVAAVIDHLFFALCDEGDGVLIPAPFYPAFVLDLTVKAKVVPIPVPTEGGGYVATAAALTAAAQQALRSGRCGRIRAVLITNPGNPHGIVMSHDQLGDILRWAMDNEIHLVSDEVYAASLYNPRPEGEAFVSAAACAYGREDEAEPAAEVDPNYVHVIYGLSKDFAASGLRVGCLYSRSEWLLRAFSSISQFSTVSHLTQYALSVLLEDEAFVDRYLEENRRRLRTSYEILARGLDGLGLPFTRPSAGLFLWVDFRPLISIWRRFGSQAVSVLDERGLALAFWRRLVNDWHIVLTRGDLCHSAEPGFFRICFAYVGVDALRELLQRLEEVKKLYQ